MTDLTSTSIWRAYPNANDGQRAVYKDDATGGALVISDLAGRDKRVILKANAGVSNVYGTPADFSMIHLRATRPDGSQTDAVIKADGTGYREIRGDNSCRPAWSWDSRFLLTCERLAGVTKLLRVSVADGETHQVMESRNFTHVFSPDGRFIVYAASPDFGKIFIMPS